MPGAYMPSYEMPTPDMGGMFGGAPMMGGWDPSSVSMMQPGGFAPSMDFMGGGYGGAFSSPYMM